MRNIHCRVRRKKEKKEEIKRKKRKSRVDVWALAMLLEYVASPVLRIDEQIFSVGLFGRRVFGPRPNISFESL